MRVTIRPLVAAAAALLFLAPLACAPPAPEEGEAPPAGEEAVPDQRVQTDTAVGDTALARAEEQASDACAERDPCVIVIGVDPANGRLTYRERESGEDAAVLRLRPEQAVRWETEGGAPWGVEFQRSRSPLPDAAYGTRPGMEQGGRIGQVSGLFKYFVAVVWERQLYTDDPEFII